MKGLRIAGKIALMAFWIFLLLVFARSGVDFVYTGF